MESRIGRKRARIRKRGVREANQVEKRERKIKRKRVRC